MLAPHEAQVTVFCGAGIPGKGGNNPGAGGIGNSPGAGGIGNSPGSGSPGSGGKSANFGGAGSDACSGEGVTSGSGSSPGRGNGGKFLERFSNISFASLSLFLFILRSRRFDAFPASTFASSSSANVCSSISTASSNSTPIVLLETQF